MEYEEESKYEKEKRHHLLVKEGAHSDFTAFRRKPYYLEIENDKNTKKD